MNNELPYGYMATITGGNYIDIQRTEINKGYAINMLRQQLNIATEQVTAIGDQQNDISMFTAANIGIAMGNAPDFLKEKADYVTDSIDHDGVVTALEHFGLI